MVFIALSLFSSCIFSVWGCRWGDFGWSCRVWLEENRLAEVNRLWVALLVCFSFWYVPIIQNSAWDWMNIYWMNEGAHACVNEVNWASNSVGWGLQPSWGFWTLFWQLQYRLILTCLSLPDLALQTQCFQTSFLDLWFCNALSAC